MMGYLTYNIYTKFISIAHGNEKCGETELDYTGHSYMHGIHVNSYFCFIIIKPIGLKCTKS